MLAGATPPDRDARLVHGDLSDFNVLMAADGPVVIDFPQSVNAASNTNARKMLIRDVDNLHRFLQRFVPGAPRLPYAEEMWELYEKGELTADSQLSVSGRAVPVGRLGFTRKAASSMRCRVITRCQKRCMPILPRPASPKIARDGSFEPPVAMQAPSYPISPWGSRTPGA